MFKRIRKFYVIDEEREYTLGRISGIINGVTQGRDHYARAGFRYQSEDGENHIINVFTTKCTWFQARKILKLAKTTKLKCLIEQ